MDLVEARQLGFAPAVRHPWELARLAVIKKFIARNLALPSRAVVFDVGCGDTFVAEQLAAEHPDAFFYAIDTGFTDDLMRRYRAGFQTSNIDVASSLEQIAPPHDWSVSLVILMDVLEHVADDAGFLARLLSRPDVTLGTQLVVTVPSYQSLFCSHDTVLGHYRRYSVRQLQALLDRSGVTVLRSGYFFCSLLPLRVVQVIRERLLRAAGQRGTGLMTWNGGYLKTSLLTSLLVLDAQVGSWLGRLGVTLPGLSTYALCRKSA
jgi:hypothetical protein